MAKLIQNGEIATEDTRVFSYQTDLNSILKPSSALRFFQEIANEHCIFFNMDFQSLYEKDMMFLLIAVSVDFYKMPALNDEITLQTWSRGVKGIQFERPSRIIDKNGEVLAVASSKWILANTNTRKLLRPKEFDFFNIPSYDLGYDLRDKKIIMPPDLEYVGDRVVRYSDIDYNGHVNNSVYADFTLDFIPDDITNKRVSKLDIYFHSEALLGDKVKMYVKKEDGAYYVKGEHERGVCFDARCELIDL